MLQADGTVCGWGHNSRSQLGIGDTVNYPKPITLQVPSDLLQVACGYNHTLAVTKDGQLWSWGSNHSGQLGSGDRADRGRPEKCELEKVVLVACGGWHSLAVTSDGSAYAWGQGYWGRLGFGDDNDQLRPQKLAIPLFVVAVAAGDQFSMALTKNGSLFVWGRNDVGQLGLGYRFDKNNGIPTQNQHLRNLNISSIHCGSMFGLALTSDGDLYGWGNNGNYELGMESHSNNQPQKLTINNVSVVACGSYHVLAMTKSREVFVWGASHYTQRNNITAKVSVPTKIIFPGLANVIPAGIICTSRTSIIITKEGIVWTWGQNRNETLGIGSTDTTTHIPEPIKNLQVSLPADFLFEVIFQWIFLGQSDSYSLYWEFPIEIIFHLVQLSFKL
jgi:alpha-tubulin suppressor-like RCC1 family protein